MSDKLGTLVEAIKEYHYENQHASVEGGEVIDSCTDGFCPHLWAMLEPRPGTRGPLSAVAFLVNGHVFGYEVDDLSIQSDFGHAQIQGTDIPWGLFYSTGEASFLIKARRWRRLGEDSWVGFRSLQKEMAKVKAHLEERIEGEWRIRLRHLDDTESTFRVTVTPGGGQGLHPSALAEALHHELDLLIAKAFRRWRQDNRPEEPWDD